jgi:hypothetical protein
MQDMDVVLQEFAKSYLDEMRDRTQDDIACWQQLDEWIDRDAEKAWLALVELSKVATHDDACRLGAGPLETLLVAHDFFATRAAELARTNGIFRSMLSCVTTRGMSEEMEQIVLAVFDDPNGAEDASAHRFGEG